MTKAEAPLLDPLDSPDLSPRENRRFDILTNSGRTDAEAWGTIMQERPPDAPSLVQDTQSKTTENDLAVNGQSDRDPAQVEIAKTLKILDEAHKQRLEQESVRNAEIAAEQQRKIDDAIRSINGNSA